MTKTIPLSQLTLALGLAIGLAGCETVSDAASSVGDTVASAASAMDPTTWFGGDDSTPPPDDTSQTASADTNVNTTPDLANLPARPPTSTPAQQQAAAQSLAADGAQARYSADALRAGTEAAAPAPAAMEVPPSVQAAAPSAASAGASPAPPSAGPSSNDAPPTTDSSPPPSTRVAVAAPPSANDAPPTADNAPPSAAAVPAPAAAPPPSAAPAAASPPAALAQGTAAVPTGAVPANQAVQTASIAPVLAAAPRPGAEPAVPAVPPNTPVRGAAMGGQVMSDTALGFKPSAAPPLDPSINQWVSAPIVARYRQTASNSIAPASQPAVPPKGVVSNAAGGAVATNFDAISNGPVSGGAAMGGGPLPTAVVYFPGDGATLSPAARALIKNAVSQYKAMGGAGSIRVVGHSSSRTANMPVEKHLELIFEKSQQRASAVAQELIHEGVPADRVLIEAVGDSQPVYYESMPQGEEGNRRAEIFVQS